MDINFLTTLIKQNTRDIEFLNNSIVELSLANKQNLMKIDNQVFIIQELHHKIERLEFILTHREFKDPRMEHRT